jgi:transketolase
VAGTEQGDSFEAITRVLTATLQADNPGHVPTAIWVKTRKGRGYLKHDAASHGSPHARNSEAFWETKRPFAERYGVTFANFGKSAPAEGPALQQEFRQNLEAAIGVLHRDQALVDDRLVELGESVPMELPSFRLDRPGNPFGDPRLYDIRSYPPELFAKPGEKRANREALGRWGAWVNAMGARDYGQPLFLASSADLAGSTNVAGFGSAFGEFQGYGWFERYGNAEGALLPQEITEFANAGIMTGLATVNLSTQPREEFRGFWGITSTYGSFSYLVYGMLRLFSQLAQDSELKLGKVVFVAGHSGPETADDSRTHFGIFAPGVMQLFPRGMVVNLPGSSTRFRSCSPRRCGTRRRWWRCTSPAPRWKSRTETPWGFRRTSRRRGAPTSCGRRIARGRPEGR